MNRCINVTVRSDLHSCSVPVVLQSGLHEARQNRSTSRLECRDCLSILPSPQAILLSKLLHPRAQPAEITATPSRNFTNCGESDDPQCRRRISASRRGCFASSVRHVVFLLLELLLAVEKRQNCVFPPPTGMECESK